MAGIKAPGAISGDAESVNGCTHQRVAEGGVVIDVGRRELACDGLLCIFCGGLSLIKGGDRSVVGAGNGDGEVVLTGSTGVITDLIGDGDDLAFALSQSVVGGVFGIKVPRAISSDGETADFCDGCSIINDSGHQGKGGAVVAINISGCQQASEGIAVFSDGLINIKGGCRCIVDRDDVELHGVGDRAAVVVGDAVVEACDAIEVGIGLEGVGGGIGVVAQLTVGDGEVDDLKIVDISDTIGIDINVGDTGEEISSREGVSGVF